MQNTNPKAELIQSLQACHKQAEALQLLASDDGDREAAADAKHYLVLAMRAVGDVDDAGECKAIIV